jgi:hypothetical protein
MSIYNAQDLVNIFSKYDPDAQVVITWWDEQDVAMYADEEGDSLAVLWDMVVEEADNALENYIGDVNDVIRNAVADLDGAGE